MASSHSTNPALLPLICTTSSLTLTLHDLITHHGLLKASTSHTTPSTHISNRTAAARTISLLWRHTLAPNLSVSLVIGLTSLITGIRTVRSLSGGMRRFERYVAVAGTLFVAAHAAFVPKIVGLGRGMACAYERAGLWQAEEEESGKTGEEVADGRVLEGQREWVKLGVWRMLLTEVPAVGCFTWLVFGGK